MKRSVEARGGRRRHSPRRVAPRPAWMLFALVLGTLWCLLLTNGLVRPDVGVDVRGAERHGSTAQVPDSVLDGGSVIYHTSDGAIRSLAIPAKTVALTFDDGPDPEWTPRILEVLRRHHVPATFFVLGAHAAEHPWIIREIRQAGGEIGVHSFSHPDLESVSPARRRYELSGRASRRRPAAPGRTARPTPGTVLDVRRPPAAG